MNEDNDNIFVITKEQAVELLSKSNFNRQQINSVSFSTLLAVSLIIFLCFLTTFIVLLLLAPIFFIEYIVKKIFEKREETKNENNNSST